jgi:hypothetical protein
MKLTYAPPAEKGWRAPPIFLARGGLDQARFPIGSFLRRQPGRQAGCEQEERECVSNVSFHQLFSISESLRAARGWNNFGSALVGIPGLETKSRSTAVIQLLATGGARLVKLSVLSMQAAFSSPLTVAF